VVEKATYFSCSPLLLSLFLLAFRVKATPLRYSGLNHFDILAELSKPRLVVLYHERYGINAPYVAEFLAHELMKSSEQQYRCRIDQQAALQPSPSSPAW
jgi:hypothetical protein